MEVRRRRRRKASPTVERQFVVLPNVCPVCEGPGYLEYINLVRETKTQTCRSCNVLWESPISDR